MELFDYIFFLMAFLVFGILLYFQLRWWAKRKLRNTPSENEYKLHITSAGFACFALMIFALLIGFSQETFSPETEFGRFISTIPGKFYYLIIVYLLTVIFGLILQKLGFILFKHPDNEE
jgi:cytochrome b561